MLTTSFKWTGGKKNCVCIETSVAAWAQKLGILKWNAWLDSEGLFVTHMACSDSVMEYCMSCWQMPCYWLWMETAALQDRRLLPSVYSHLIFNNGAISEGRTWSKYMTKFMILTWMLQWHGGEESTVKQPLNLCTCTWNHPMMTSCEKPFQGSYLKINVHTSNSSLLLAS